ncbi:hypothetical protein HRE53_27335 (plasmid) [Acaryochloris sp. 'Moss Beach']|uniref:hypothetical protein n=1 Tax=Acaryochloris sp. 'Moss Beach' TaxID=2740837 RepID=UPI001F400A1F|nr:hypothetical protein [Acaryochloris sp. 'Moss Beach']UJB72311.1 hypothetical protein HRE53_27335 [Acaryochloris sp. 'Moss Beach']
MLKTFLSRLWQQVTQRFVRSQADDPVDEAEEFKRFYRKELIEPGNRRRLYQHELVEACRELGYDIQSVEPDPDIDPMTTAVWVGSNPLLKKLGPYVRKVDFIAAFEASKKISMAQHLEANPELYEAHQAAVDDCLKHLEG